MVSPELDKLNKFLVDDSRVIDRLYIIDLDGINLVTILALPSEVIFGLYILFRSY